MALAQGKTLVTLGTATPGGGFPMYGDAYSSTLNAMDATLDVQPKNTKGSTENVPLLAAGKLDIAQATGEVTYEALNGIGQAPVKLYVINAMYSQSGCSSCARTARTRASPISRANRSRGARKARASSCSRAT